MDTYIFCGLAVIGLAVSFFKNKKKTVMALKKAWRAFENILPQFLVVLLVVGVMLAVLDSKVISRLIGTESGWYGTVIAALGTKFSVTRLLIDISGIIVIAFILTKLILKKDVETICKNAENID